MKRCKNQNKIIAGRGRGRNSITDKLLSGNVVYKDLTYTVADIAREFFLSCVFVLSHNFLSTEISTNRDYTSSTNHYYYY
jgi:hypothetical protein